MARKISQTDPALAIEFFLSGFYTHRSQLFAPFKGIGVNVVSFHDPVIDGNNMEDTDLYEWSRRPGFSMFCTVSLPDSEIVNQFYSSRNLNGTVLPFVDTTRRLAIFSPTSITTILNKTTSAQGYITTIGNMTYISDGASADLTKFDGTNLSAWGLAAPTTIPVSSGTDFWQPDTHFSLGNSIQDTNGNIETVTAILVPNGGTESPTTFRTLALAGGTGTWTGSIGPGGTVSETLNAPGFTNYLFFGDANFGIPIGATILGITVSLSKEIIGGTAIDESVKLIIGGAAAGVEHASVVPWSPSALTNISYGSPTDNWGGLTPAQANTNGPSGFGVGISANILTTTFYGLVQRNTVNTTLATSTVCPFPNSVTAGNTIIVGIHAFAQGSFIAIHDNVGNVYAQVTSRSHGQQAQYIFVASNAIAGATTVTVTTNGVDSNRFTAVNIHEFNGVVTVTPVDVAGSNDSGGSANLTPFSTGNVTTGHAADMIFSFNYCDGGGATIPAGYTAGTSQTFSAAGGTQQIASAFLLAAGAGPYSPSWSSGNTGTTVALKSALSPRAIVGAGSPFAPIITIYYKLPSGSGPGFSGTNEPIWPNNLSNSVNDGGIAWTNYGSPAVWFPLTNYATPIVILDTNGFLQLALSAANTVQPWNAGTTYGVGTTVSFGGGFWISTAASNLNVAPNANYTVATTGGGGAVTTVAYWASTSNPAVTGSIAPVWNTMVGGLTVDGSYTWKNIGHGTPLAVTGYAYVYGFRTIYGHLTTSSPFSNNTGAILGPLNGSITQFSITGNVVTFQGSNNFLVGDVFTVSGLISGTYLNEQIFTVLAATPSQIFPLTSVQVNGSNTLIIQALNNLVVGESVTFSSVAAATFLNGVTVTVSATGLSGTQFEASFTHATYGPTADTGEVLLNGSWTAAFTHPDVGNTSDAGVALPLISMVVGTGTASPLCNSVANITGFSVTDNIITIIATNNFQPGLWVTIQGLTNAPYLDGQQVQVIAVDQPVGTPNTQFEVFFETPNSVSVADSGTATFNAVEIYRTSDGGGAYLFAGAVTNPGASLPWTFDDFVPDANLDITLIAPLGHQNDPPPGASGSTITTRVGTITTYWNGRLWIAAGNFVYFTAGPDCTNGVPEESCPPGNRFQYAGPVLGLEPLPNGAGILVYLADRVNVILGGPETISFYPDDFLKNFGISNPNALFKDGVELGQFTTQKQYIELDGKDKRDVGEHIADYLAANFSPTKTYATMHRNGLDVGLFLSNGVDRIVRYGSNIGAWSVPAFPIFGAGAIQSIETSVGVYSLMAASPTGGVTGTTPIINPSSGITVAGTGTPWINPGNITIGNPTTYATVTLPILTPVTFVQGANASQSGGGTGTTTPPQNAVFSSGNTAGNFIIAYLYVATQFSSGAFDPHTPLLVTDSQGNIYTQIGSRQVTFWGSGNNTISAETIYVAQNIKAGANTVTATTGAAPGSPSNTGVTVSISVVEYTGSPSVVAVVTSSGFASPGATNLPVTLTTNHPNQVVLLASFDGGTAAGFVQRNSFFYDKTIPSPAVGTYTITGAGGTAGQAFGLVLDNMSGSSVNLSQILRAAFQSLPVPNTAIIQGVQLAITGKQTDTTGTLNITVTPTNPTAGAETHTFMFGSTNTTLSFGSSTDLWGMPWTIPSALTSGALSFDVTAAFAGNGVMTLSDNFARPDASPVSGNWSVPMVGHGLQIVSGLVEVAVTSTACWEISTAIPVWPADQNSSVTITTCSGAASAGPIVRADSSAETFYEVVAVPSGPNLLVMVKVVAGSGTVLGTAPYTFTPGDTITLTATGTTLVAQVNGVTAITETDSAIASGSPGIAQDATVANTAQISFWSSTVPESTAEVFVSEVQVTLTYQNPGNYLYARDVNSWGDCGSFGLNNGTPYPECNITVGSITLSQLGGAMFPLQHVVGYFDGVGTLGTQGNGGPSVPNVWILPNEVNTTAGVGFVQLPEFGQEPPLGQNQPSQTILALRWPVNMLNSSQASQFIHHLQVKIDFEPENAPNTIKALAFKEQQD